MASPSSGAPSRKLSVSDTGRRSVGKRSASHSHKQIAPQTTLTPDNSDAPFEPCAATASHLLYAQQNRILVLRHGTLAIERRFDHHREDVLWIVVDNVSEKGSGRLAVSFDAGKTAIVWDIRSGVEISRFSAYEHIRAASFMRNANIAFGNDQGNIILFEASTSEHISARTIFDPITAIAPSADCRTFAIGYFNGSILVATLQPSFTIIYTLASTRAPSKITGLSWHGSSSKQKTDMLATQTVDGDLRVWSVPKVPANDPPTIIRVLQRAEYQLPGPCWFAWSKNGRIVQHADGETRSWDVRTKKVSCEIVPTIDGIVALANYGPAAIMFTLTRDHGVQQYDLDPNGLPVLVANVKHIPADPPPTPPVMSDERKDVHGQSRSAGEVLSLPMLSDAGESSTDEGTFRSPLEKVKRELDSLDALEDELRDKVMPLSPGSSRTSSVSSRSSGGQRRRKYLYDRPDSRPDSSRAPSLSGYTEFSVGPPSIRPARDSISVRSTSSLHSNSRHRASGLRNQVTPSLGEHRSFIDAREPAVVDLFPNTRARLRDVPFRTPHYGNVARTPELLQREMLSVVFGWNDTARSLIRDEMQRRNAGSPAAVLLAKWLGDTAADHLSSTKERDAMTSADWMMLAINSIGAESRRQVAETFVQRLLEQDDIHPAVAMLLGLGEHNEAIELYVAQHYWVEAVLLTCITLPTEWRRISYMLRKWGEYEVQLGQADLAVRCLSCTSIETTEPWYSPRAQDATYVAQQERLTRPPSAGPPLSPPSRSGSLRLAQKNAALKLITTFGEKGVPVNLSTDRNTPMHNIGVTPIAQSALPFSALSPGAPDPWQQRLRTFRDPSSARTATPGAYKPRLPNGTDMEPDDAMMTTPVTAARDAPPRLPLGAGRRTSSLSSLATTDPTVSLQPDVYKDTLAPPKSDHYPPPSAEAFARLRVDSQGRHHNSQERKPDGLAVQVMQTRYMDNITPGPATGTSFVTHSSKASLNASSARGGATRSIDEYLHGVNEARERSRERRAHSKHRERSKKRDGSRKVSGTSRPRDPSESGEQNVRYIKPPRRSPSSPVPMSPEDVALATEASKLKPDPATSEDENFYKAASPVASHTDQHLSKPNFTEEQGQEVRRDRGSDNPDRDVRARSPIGMHSRASSRRGRSAHRQPGSATRSPSSPLPMPSEPQTTGEHDETNSDGRRVRLRAASHTSESGRSRRDGGKEHRTRSSSRKVVPSNETFGMALSTLSKSSLPDSWVAGSNLSTATDSSVSRSRGLTKALAQRELEERRLSLARRPSAPSFPMPESLVLRPPLPRSNTESNSSSLAAPVLHRSQVSDTGEVLRQSKTAGISTPSVPIGLPSTPRAMRHPRYANNDSGERGDTPRVPELPDNMSNLSSIGSNPSHAGSALSQGESYLSQVTASNLSSAPSNVTSNLESNVTSNVTKATSYLSSNFSYGSSSQVSPNPQIYGADNVAPLLPPSVFAPKAVFRPASAPLEQTRGIGVHPAYKPNLAQSSQRHSYARKVVPHESYVDQGDANPSIDETLASTEDQVFLIDNDDPPVLPELQHLADPPPPPPPPSKTFPLPRLNTGSGMISIAIGDTTPASPGDVPATLSATSYQPRTDRSTATSPMERVPVPVPSPNMHRRGRGSVTEAFGSRFRDFGDRMRSTSRTSTKSPAEYRSLPYESVPPPFPTPHRRRESEQRAQSSYESSTEMQDQAQMLPPPPPPPPPPPSTGPDGKLLETSIAPQLLPRTTSAPGGHRNPKEVRANMPPDRLQSGVYQGSTVNF